MSVRGRITPLLAILVCLAGNASAEDETVAIERKAILARVNSYVDAFNFGDAAALAGHWSESAEYLTPAGTRLEGRKALAEHFAKLFAASPAATLEVQVEHVRFPEQDVAIEEGTARVSLGDGEPTVTSYLAVHIRRSGQWQLDTVRELQLPAATDTSDVAPSAYEYLKELEWMIGEWHDADEQSHVTTSVRWSARQSFITRTFRVSVGERIDLEGTQVIGWDPTLGQIRSWVFDSDGGFGTGLWTHDGDHWVIQALATLPDGRQATAVQILTPLADGHFTWELTQREVDGQLLPNIEPVTMTRVLDSTISTVDETKKEAP